MASSADAQAQTQLWRGALLISSVRYLRNVALSSTMATFVIKSGSILCDNCVGMSSMFADNVKLLQAIRYPSIVVSVFSKLAVVPTGTGSGMRIFTAVPPPTRDSTAQVPPNFNNRAERFFNPCPS